MSLSDKVQGSYYTGDQDPKFIMVEDVKEFIKKRDNLLQEYLERKIPLIIFLERKDKLAGDLKWQNLG